MRKVRDVLFLPKNLFLTFLGVAVISFLVFAIVGKVAAADINKSYVSSFGVKSSEDGMAPWDSDDELGNDSGPKNGKVRTFDRVSYNLAYVTSLMDGERVVNEGNLMVLFELNVDPKVAQFDADTLNWMENRVITYTYSDGSTSDTWDKTKTVVKQTYSGRRHLTVNENGSNAIPGAGTLSAGVYIRAAKNGDTIKPTFKVWMEGNADNLKKTAGGTEVTVTAAPRYNLRLSRNTIDEPLGYYNFSTGEVSDQAAAGTERGRLEGYGVGIHLHNSLVSKGLKGIELPTGDITFDINLNTILQDDSGTRDVTNEGDFEPKLWDYKEQDYNPKRGHLNRKMLFHEDRLSYGVYLFPGNKGTTNYYCHNGGNISLTQDETTKNIYHVTIKDYDFDLDNLQFPIHYLGDADYYTRDDKNVGWFSTGYYEFLIRFPETVNSTSVIRTTIKAENFKATSVSGQTTTTETVTTDNANSYNVTVIPKGTYSSYILPLNESATNTSYPWSGGAGYAYLGSDGWINIDNAYSGDLNLAAINDLVKFEDKYVDVTNDAKTIVKATNSASIGDPKVLFAAKPDKTGWASDDEMNQTREEGLIYFEDVDVLKARGYKCVGILVELRNVKLYSSEHTFRYKIKIKDDPDASGKTAMFKQESRAWRSDDVDMGLSWTNYPNSNVESAYGLGDSSIARGSYTTGYKKPFVDYFRTYTRTMYSDGTISGGHVGSIYGGNTLLLIGAENHISIEVNDKATSGASTGEAKMIYDLDKGERTAEFKINPSVKISSTNSSITTSGQKTDVTVKALLPKGLSYIIGSASADPVNVVKNTDGSSEIVWLIRNVTVGQPMESITFKTTIGAAGTIDDVANNDKLTVQATITSTADKRNIIPTNGNIADTTISVIKLSTSSISKTVGSQLTETGANIDFSLRYGNSDNDMVPGVRLMDILPYNEDGRGTDYHGDYRVASVRFDFKDAPTTYNRVKETVAAYHTNSASAKDKANVDTTLTNQTGKSWTKLTGGIVNDTAKTVTFNTSIKGVTAMYFDIGDVSAKEYVAVVVALSPVDESDVLYKVNNNTQQGGDIYANNFYEYANGQVGVVTSNYVQTQVVSRELTGVAWYDADNDGIRDSGESTIPNASVDIYDATGARAKTILGTEIAGTKTNASGAYSFSMLPAGNYVVKIAGNDYGLTLKDRGDNDALDSDATPTVENGTLVSANINVTMPAASAMPVYNYKSENHDAGFTRATLQVRKENKDGSLVGGAVFSFANKTYNAANGTFTIPGLGVGVGTLTETEAPQGYKAAGPWTVRTTVAADGTISASIDNATKNGQAFILTNYLKDSKIKNKITKSSTTTEITKKDQAIDYKIKYDVELTDYMGDAKVKIVDKLPHPIVEDQSELDGGVYDVENLTITWEEDWVDINTYVGANTKSFEHNISLVYDGILGTDRELNNEATGEVTLKNVDTEPTNETEPGDEEDDVPTPIKIPGRIITHFKEKGTDKEVCKNDDAVGLIGDPYQTHAKECEGYELVESPEKEDYNFEEEDQIVTYYYRKLPKKNGGIENPNTADNAKVFMVASVIIAPALIGGIIRFSKRR